MAITNCPACGARREWDPFTSGPCDGCVERERERRWGRRRRGMAAPVDRPHLARRLGLGYLVYVILCVAVEVEMGQARESGFYRLYLATALLGAVAAFVIGLFRMRRILNPSSGRFVHLPLFIVPSLAALAVLAPPFVLPLLL